MTESAKCPNCKKAAAPRPENKAAPFCSERCRMIDLGKWFDEEHRIPVESADEETGEGGGNGVS